MKWDTAWRVFIMLELLVLLRALGDLVYYRYLLREPSHVESTGHCWDEECQG